MPVLCLSVGARQYFEARVDNWPSTLGDFSLWTLRQLSPATTQLIYLGVMLFLVLSLLAVAFRPGEKPGECRYSGLLFSTIIFCLLLFARWPSYAISQQMNPDESQVLAGALRLQQDFSYFRTVDGTTHGPLLSYVVWLPSLFGMSIDLATGRLVQTFLQVSTLLVFWRAVANYSSERGARLVATPLVVLYACLTEVDYLHNTSEQVPVFCLTLGLLGLAKLCSGDASKMWKWSLFTGTVLGAIPMAKLQAVPAGLVLGLGAVIFVLFGVPREVRQKSIALLILGAFLPTLCLVLPTLWGGEFHDFLKRYILGNLDYSGVVRQMDPSGTVLFRPITMWDRVYEIPEVFVRFPQWKGFFYAQLLVVFLATYLSPNEVWGSRSRRAALTLSALLFLSSLWSIVFPGNAYLHYVYLIFVPTSTLVAVVVAATLHKWSLKAQGITLGLVTLGLVWGTGVPGYNSSILRQTFATARSSPKVWINPVALAALEYAEPGEYLGLWGWYPEVWVTGGFVPATRDLIGERLIESRFDSAYYRAQFLEELARTEPPVFVDVVGVGSTVYRRPDLYGHQTFPELKQYLEQNYRYMGELPNGFGRLFVSKQRLEQLERADSPPQVR